MHLTAGEFLSRSAQGIGTLVRDGRATELPRAIEWLRNRLSRGKVLSDLVRRDARDNDISEMTLRRAFARLGGWAGREIGSSQWHWRLPRTLVVEDTAVTDVK